MALPLMVISLHDAIATLTASIFFDRAAIVPLKAIYLSVFHVKHLSLFQMLGDIGLQ